VEDGFGPERKVEEKDGRKRLFLLSLTLNFTTILITRTYNSCDLAL
jgi:hypothetical protein